jgi:hypothetical protein
LDVRDLAEVQRYQYFVVRRLGWDVAAFVLLVAIELALTFVGRIVLVRLKIVGHLLDGRRRDAIKVSFVRLDRLLVSRASGGTKDNTKIHLRGGKVEVPDGAIFLP